MSEWAKIPGTEGSEPYFYNETTGESQWDPPEGWVEECDPNWTEVVDPESEDKYYYNTATEESTWEKPVGFVCPAAESVDEANRGSDWIEVVDPDSNETYYFNTVTEESVWDRPAEFQGGSGMDEGDAILTHDTSSPRSSLRKRSSVRFSVSSPPVRRDGSIAGPPAPGAGYEDLSSVNSSSSRRGSLFRNSQQDDDQSAHMPDGEEKSSSLAAPSYSSSGALSALNRGAAVKTVDANDLSTVDPEAPLEDLARTMVGVSLEQFALNRVNGFRRKSLFAKGGEGPAGATQLNASALSWSDTPLPQPLTVGASATPELCAISQSISKNILAFMGDRKSHNKSPVEVATAIVLLLLQSAQEARDEALLQICKQIRQNPNANSAELGWQLLLICLACFAPSRDLSPPLMSFCLQTALTHKNLLGAGENRAADDSTAHSASASDFEILRCSEKAARACIRSAMLPPRVDMPGNDELEALRRGAKMAVGVHLVDGRVLQVMVDSWTSVGAMASTVALELGVHGDNSQCFALYEAEMLSATGIGIGVGGGGIVAGAGAGAGAGAMGLGAASAGAGAERLLLPDERVLDLHSLWLQHAQSNAHTPTAKDRRQQAPSFRFLFKISLFLDCTPRGCAALDADPAAIQLLYAQAVSDVLAARYPLSEQDAVALAALQAQELLGDLPMPSRIDPLSAAFDGTLTDTSPRPLSQYAPQDSHVDLTLLLGGRSLHHFMHRRFLGSHTDTHERLLQRRQAVERAMLAAYERLRGFSPREARLAYLCVLRANRLYGAAYFRAQAARAGGAGAGSGGEVILAITPSFLVVVQPEQVVYLMEYPLAEIEEWGYKEDSSTVVLVLPGDEKVYFRTAQAKAVVALLDEYSLLHD